MFKFMISVAAPNNINRDLIWQLSLFFLITN